MLNLDPEATAEGHAQTSHIHMVVSLNNVESTLDQT